mmetsp:Transcript_47037/g.131107  ORF Transcript_47037/g.131107 Transcript_47037/m.131107 type:complete len:203 (-) Transcript_47037:611-1219(-)
MVAVIPRGVVCIPAEYWLHFIHDKRVELLALSQGVPQEHDLLKLAEAGVARLVVIYVATEIILPPEDTNARVPNAFKGLVHEPWRQPRGGPPRKVVHMQDDLPFTPPEAERQEVRVGDPAVHVDLHGLRDIDHELIYFLRVACPRCLRGRSETPQLLAENLHDVQRGDRSRIGGCWLRIFAALRIVVAQLMARPFKRVLQRN